MVTLEDLAISTMWETSALVELLERKGVLTRQDVYDAADTRSHHQSRAGHR